MAVVFPVEKHQEDEHNSSDSDSAALGQSLADSDIDTVVEWNVSKTVISTTETFINALRASYCTLTFANFL